MGALVSVFPDGSAGCGLLLLRVALAIGLVLDAYDAAKTWSLLAVNGLGALAAIVLVAGSVFVILGYATTVVSFGLSLMQCVPAVAAIITSARFSELNNCALLQAGVTLALALIGPGAYSIDARIYGRREVTIFRHNDGE